MSECKLKGRAPSVLPPLKEIMNVTFLTKLCFRGLHRVGAMERVLLRTHTSHMDRNSILAAAIGYRAFLLLFDDAELFSCKLGVYCVLRAYALSSGVTILLITSGGLGYWPRCGGGTGALKPNASLLSLKARQKHERNVTQRSFRRWSLRPRNFEMKGSWPRARTSTSWP